jgi:hypothetical protein
VPDRCPSDKSGIQEPETVNYHGRTLRVTAMVAYRSQPRA